MQGMVFGWRYMASGFMAIVHRGGRHRDLFADT